MNRLAVCENGMAVGFFLVMLGSAARVGAVTLHAREDRPSWKLHHYFNVDKEESIGVSRRKVPPAVSRNTTAQSLCVDGVILPELFVLGASKVGTSSLAKDLRNSGVASNSEPKKESHILDEICEGHSKFLKAGKGKELSSTARLAARTEAWQRATAKNKCGSPTPKRVIAEYTADNFKFAEPPSDWGALDWTTCENMPLMLKQFYSSAHASRLQFVVMVREPLQRYQSAFYFMTRLFMNMQFVTPGVFEGQVTKVIDLAKPNSTLAKPYSTFTIRGFWESLYGRQLQGWLNHFEPRQFYIIPMMHYLRAGGRDATFADLSARLDVEIKAQPDNGIKPDNQGYHPTLEQDVSPAVRAEFQTLIAPENELFVKLLASASTKGMGLASYDGAAGSEEDVKTWLEAGW